MKVFCEVDTLSNRKHRNQLLLDNKLDLYHQELVNDAPIFHARAIVNGLYHMNCAIVHISQTPTQYADLLRTWLTDNKFLWTALFSPRPDDNRPYYIIKKEFIKRLIQDNKKPDLAIEKFDFHKKIWDHFGIECIKI